MIQAGPRADKAVLFQRKIRAFLERLADDVQADDRADAEPEKPADGGF